jgi:hypothetical protein
MFKNHITMEADRSSGKSQRQSPKAGGWAEECHQRFDQYREIKNWIS